jgi:hypothetical protein
MLDLMSTEANALRCGYDVGYFDKSDIAQWADRQIEACDVPSDALLDLSMNRRLDPLDVIKLLQSFGEADPAASIRIHIGFIGLLLAKKGISIQMAIRGLWKLVHEPDVTSEEQRAIYLLDEGYNVAAAGYHGTLDNVDRELRGFIMPYADRLAEQFPHLIPAGE